MKIRTIRISAAILATATFMTLLLAGCSDQSQSGESDVQKAKRQALIQKHKDAIDSGH